MMNHHWPRAALIAGVVYLVIGRTFAWPTDHVVAWRWAAWAVSGAVFATHIGYEHFGSRHSPLATALHAAVAVAIGAFGLAVAGALNSLRTTAAIQPLWLLAFVAWPALTALPAFLMALAASAVLARLPRSAR